MSNQNNNVFWGDHPKVLFQKDLLSQFFPRNYMSRNQKLNAISRLLIYISIVLTFYRGNSTYIFLGIFGLLCIWMCHSFSSKARVSPKEGMMSSSHAPVRKIPKPPTKYISPTRCNPFMNPLPSGQHSKEIKESKLKEPSSDYDKVQSDIENKFNQGLFKEVSDVFGRESSQRQFYTLPNTTNVSDQDNFAKWLYSTPPTCKEGNGEACVQHNHQHLQGNLFASI